ncbi:hypothetical protein [Burkholderia sp. IT-111MI5]|uniref:hypothetical protein n=1 Tax=Burkholderia sp. IT-111MI5 TaxID=3026439 RepID=UPI0039DFB969
MRTVETWLEIDCDCPSTRIVDDEDALPDGAPVDDVPFDAALLPLLPLLPLPPSSPPPHALNPIAATTANVAVAGLAKAHASRTGAA